MIKTSNKKIIILLSLIPVGMFVFGFALVPLYSVLCNALGINGKTNQYSEKNMTWVDHSRTVSVLFVANINSNLPWEFYPKIRKIEIHPGENYQLAYFAKNNSDHTMMVQAIPSVTPGIAARHLKKTQC